MAGRLRHVVGRGLRAFGHFWWDFLVGDAPEFFIGTVAIVVVALLLHHHRTVAIVVLPVTAVVFLVASTVRAARRSSHTP
jgi:hypothetical protein